MKKKTWVPRKKPKNSSKHLENQNLSLFCENITQVKSIHQIGDCIGLLGEDNSVVIYDLNTKIKCIIYPPPTAADVKQLVYSKDLHRVILLLFSGTICVYKIDGDTGLLEKIIYVGDVKDALGRSVMTPPNTMELTFSPVPFFDSEVTHKKKLGKQQKTLGTYSWTIEDSYLALAVGKGSIMFIHLEHLTRVHARFYFNREKITEIKEVSNYLVTLCINNTIVISKMSKQEVSVLREFDFRKSIDFLVPLVSSKFFLGFESGETELIRIQDQKLFRIDDLYSESEVKILSAGNYTDKLAVSTNDSRIQVFNLNKQVVNEVEFSMDFTSILFTENRIFGAHENSVYQVELPKELPQDFENPEQELEDSHYTTTKVTNDFHFHDESITFYEESVKSSLKNYEKSFSVESPTLQVYEVQIDPRRSKSPKRFRRSKGIKEVKPKVVLNPPLSPKSSIIQRAYNEVLSSKMPSLQSKTNRTTGPTIMTRRELTGEKIASNIVRHGVPADQVDYTGLCVIDEELYYKELEKLNNS